MNAKQPPFQIGTATCDLTPPVGSPMAAFPVRPEGKARITESVRDPLEAHALALSQGGEQLVLVSCDVCGIRLADVDRVRALVKQRAPHLADTRLLLAAVHSHASFDSLYLFCWTADHPWIETMIERLAETIIAACANLSPVHLSFGTTEHRANFNRRAIVADGKARLTLEYVHEADRLPTDPELAVLLADSVDGQRLAQLLHYTAHPITLGPGNRQFSADWPGEVRRLLTAAAPGSQALVVNGAAGNIHPHVCMRDHDEALVATANGIASAARRAIAAATPLTGLLQARTRRLTFTNRHDDALTVDVEVSAVRLGALLLVTLPGEFFVEYQLDLKQTFAPRPVVVIGYCNGWPGYIPTPEAYALGGYGVDLHTADPPDLSRTALPPEAGPIVMNAVKALCQDLLAETTQT